MLDRLLGVYFRWLLFLTRKIHLPLEVFVVVVIACIVPSELPLWWLNVHKKLK